jgi:predicted transcriptional regulator
VVADDDGAQARISLRLPDSLKSRVDDAAASAGLSVNAWLARAVAAAVDPSSSAPSAGHTRGGGEKFSGWVV